MLVDAWHREPGCHEGFRFCVVGCEARRPATPRNSASTYYAPGTALGCSHGLSDLERISERSGLRHSVSPGLATPPQLLSAKESISEDDPGAGRTKLFRSMATRTRDVAPC